jgi:hypothetical protein
MIAEAPGIGSLVKAMARRVKAKPHQTAANKQGEYGPYTHRDPAMHGNPGELSTGESRSKSNYGSNQQGNKESENNPSAQAGL